MARIPHSRPATQGLHGTHGRSPDPVQWVLLTRQHSPGMLRILPQQHRLRHGDLQPHHGLMLPCLPGRAEYLRAECCDAAAGAESAGVCAGDRVHRCVADAWVVWVYSVEWRAGIGQEMGYMEPR